MLQESAGLVMFAGVALIALGLGTTFFFNYLANSGSLFGMSVPFGPNPGELNTGGVLPLMNIAVGIEVWGGLAIVILYMLSGIREGRGGLTMFWNLPYMAVVLLAIIGIATILLKRNLIKIFLGVSILTSAVNLFIIALGYREGGIAPIFTNGSL